MDKTKECCRCKRSLSADDTHFFKFKHTKDGLESSCKECRGFSFKNPKRKAKDGCKVCGSCGLEKKASEEFFYTSKTAKDGFRGTCKICARKTNNKSRQKHKEERNHHSIKYYYENKESLLEQKREHRQKNHQKLKTKDKRYYEENKKEVKKKAREYYHINKEKRNEYIKGWRKNNNDKIQIYSIKRRTAKRGLPDNFSVKQWNECKKHFDYKCCYCGKEEKLTQDHFIPLSSGGEYTKNNIVPCCKNCNSSKNNRDFFEWYTERKFYSKQREQKIIKYLGYKELNDTFSQQLSLI